MFSPQGFSAEEVDAQGQPVKKKLIQPRIGILGVSTFSQDGSAVRKLDNQPSNTVNKTLKSIEEHMVLGYEHLAAFKQEAQGLRRQIDTLMQELIEKVENVQEDTSPEIYKDYKQLKSDINEQREEKQALEKMIERIARET